MAKRYRSAPSSASGTVKIDWESFARSFRKIRPKRYSRPENDARHALLAMPAVEHDPERHALGLRPDGRAPLSE
jgi:hypothetical protein